MATSVTADKDYPASCPQCGTTPVTLVSVGDPNKAKEDVVDGDITVSTHMQFLSCESCKYSWHLPTKGAA